MERVVVTAGLDTAKNVFQVHAVAADYTVLVRRKLPIRSHSLLRGVAALPGRHGNVCFGASLGGNRCFQPTSVQGMSSPTAFAG